MFKPRNPDFVRAAYPSPALKGGGIAAPFPLIEARGLRNGLAVLDDPVDVKRRGFLSSAMACASSRDFPAVTTPGKSGKDTPKSLSDSLWISPI